MTAGELRAALERLRRAGARLRSRPARETTDALARVLDTWRAPTSAPRRALEAELPQAAGFSPETVCDGLAVALEGWTGDALRALVARELGAPEAMDDPAPAVAAGFATTGVILGGALPTPTLLALLLPLVLRSPVLAKTALHDPVTARIVAQSLAEEDEELGACVEVVSFPGADPQAAGALLEAECVVVSGSDATIANVAERVRPPRRLVAYGHRVSVAALGPEAVRGAALERAASDLALDVSLWDQLGCLSPVAVYVDGEAGAASEVGRALAGALGDAAGRRPPGRVGPRAAEAIARERAEAEMRAAAGPGVSLHAGPELAWTVVCEADARPRPAPLHRFVRVHPVAGRTGLETALRPLSPHLAAVGVAGFGARTPAIARALADLGASRVCPLGAMQAPPLGWRHDGQPLLLPMARLCDLETQSE